MPPDSLPLQSRGPSSATLAAKLWCRSRKLAASTFALALATLYTAIRAAHAYRVATFNLPPNLTNPSPNPNHLPLNPPPRACASCPSATHISIVAAMTWSDGCSGWRVALGRTTISSQ